jgi:glycyl-tRNA synthetase
MNKDNLLDKVSALAKRRGFIFPGSEIYGGLANSWDYGPVGVELKNNVKKLWWKRYVHDREDVVGIDAALIMNPGVWKASGHLDEFVDPLVECKECHKRYREDHLEKKECPDCSGLLTAPKQFNMMFKTNLGPVESEENTVYFRPETAQAMFVNFKNILNTTRQTIPFGVAQIGKAFRNEITPGNYIFRTREFEQMEIEYFIPKPKSDEDWQKYFEDWRTDMMSWMELVGIDMSKVSELEVPDEERAHYSKRTVDFEFDFPFGKDELYGLAYRTDFDLKNHEESSKENLKYKDIETGEEYWPHVIEPTWGVDRTVLAVLLSAYHEDGDRVVMKFEPEMAPYKVAVFPLVKNKPDVVDKAKEVFDKLKTKTSAIWDDRGNIGKRYFSQDEIGTPYCITIDYQTLEDGTVTVRDRDSAEQERVKVEDLESKLSI